MCRAKKVVRFCECSRACESAHPPEAPCVNAQDIVNLVHSKIYIKFEIL